tara:strand:+ start:654 stop:998 length:345 start_codon:yes stop_codon:yes gene_type:complete
MTNLIIFVENCIADAPMLIVKTIFALLLVGIVTALVVLTVEVVSADSDIEWNSVPVEQVTSIEDADFFYADPGMCWGITWNGPQDWTVKVITGEYTVQRVNNFVDYSEIISCEA